MPTNYSVVVRKNPTIVSVVGVPGVALGPSFLPSGIDSIKIADGSVSNTEFQSLNGVTGSIQTQLDTKADASSLVGLATTTYVNTQDIIVATNAASALSSGLAGKADTSHQHPGADITSGTVDPARLGAGSPASSKFLDGSSNWRKLSSADLPAGLSSGVGYGQTAPSAFALGLYGYGVAGDSTQPGVTCGGTPTAGSVIYNCPSNKTHNFLVSGNLALLVGSGLGAASDTNWAIGRYGVAGANAAYNGIVGNSTSIYYNAGTGGGHSIRVGNTVVGLIQASLITFSAPVALGNSYTATAGSNQIVGTASGVQINAPWGSTVAISINGTTRASLGFNGLVFAPGSTAAAPGNISIGSDAGGTMSLNVPSGGLYLLGEAATSGVAISAASKYLQFQGSGGILGAAGNAGYCYIAGGNVAANSSCAYIRVYGVSASSNAGQAVYACGNVAGAKHSFVDSSGTERLKIDETAVTALGPLVTPAATPASATATGTAGQWAWDASYIYICTATNTWRRVAHSTW